MNVLYNKQNHAEGKGEMKQFELMIFDLDGTLVDSARDLIDAVN